MYTALLTFLHAINPLFLILGLSFIPALFYSKVLYSLNVYRNGPLMLVFFWGAFIATTATLMASGWVEACIYDIMNVDTTADTATATIDMISSSLVAPVVEESLKGLAVLVVYLVFRKEFTSVLDGVVYGGIAALGFAATENVLYLSFFGYLDAISEGRDGVVGVLEIFVLRVIMGAWGHPFATSFFGIGLALAFLRRHILFKLLAPICGWLCAVFFHSLHNGGAMVLSTIVPHVLYIGAILGTIEWFGFALLLWFLGSRCHDETRWYQHAAA